VNNHTCGYKIGFDNELSVGDKTYYVEAEVSVEFDGDVDVQSIEVTKCEIEAEEGVFLPWTTEGGTMEKIVVAGHPELTKAIEDALDEEIRTFAEDNCRFIGLDVAEDYEMARAEWFRE
jgi:hypothetical protein